jgi:hypothetical protein
MMLSNMSLACKMRWDEQRSSYNALSFAILLEVVGKRLLGCCLFSGIDNNLCGLQPLQLGGIFFVLQHQNIF